MKGQEMENSVLDVLIIFWVGIFIGASGMTRSVILTLSTGERKLAWEVTGRVRVPAETLMTGTPSRNARASAARRSPKEAAGKLLARRT